MIKFTIPEPCQKDWNTMTPNIQGAFCISCQKNVIDFTLFSDYEILHFLKNNLHIETCGRIEVKQLERVNLQIDENILYTNISLWKKYLAIILICFGFMITGCNKNEEKFQSSGGLLYQPVELNKKKDSIIILPQPCILEVTKLETLTGVMIIPVQAPPSVIAGGIAFEYVVNDTIILAIDTIHNIVKDKVNDTIIKSKDSISLKMDSCITNGFTKL